MIQIAIQDGVTPYIEEWCERPTVYLDHWAWRRISEDEHLAARFVKVLKKLHGTLALSWLNVIEFGRLTEERQAAAADRLLDKVVPRIFLVTPDFLKVIATEDRLKDGETLVAPHGDLLSLRAFFEINVSGSGSLSIYRNQNLFTLAQKCELTAKYDNFAQRIIGHLTSLRRDYTNNPRFKAIVRRKPEGDPIQCGTRFIAGELVGSLLKNSQLEITSNHAIDLCHAVVSVAYCDYVLLDQHWATQVESARKRIKGAGMSFPIAKVFSERRNGLEEFFRELEGN